jgi:hypothetical protein
MDYGSHFGLEIDALYKSLRFDALLPATPAIPVSLSTSSGHVFDFPVLLKYRPWGRRWRFMPYVDAGPSFRYVNTSEQRRFFAGQDQTIDFDRSFAQISSFNVGITFSTGVDIPVRESIRLAPEIRWTTWTRENFRSAPTLGTITDTFDYQNSQVELLLGVTF